MFTATRSKPLPDAREVIAAIERVVEDAPRPVPLHEPSLTGNEGKYVQACISEGWVSSVGAYVDRFERELAATCGTPYAVAIMNGTCALHAAMAVMGIQPGDEVLVPSLTFVATANAVAHAGAVPHFVEVEEASLGIDPMELKNYLAEIATVKSGITINKKTGRPIRGLMPVHIFGHPCQADALKAVADEFRLIFLEDATEALGSTAQGRPVGSRHTAVFSFNGNKIVTTGGGGAIVTSDEPLYHKLKHATTTGKQPHPWAFYHDIVAWNYRLPNINAALGCAQLEQLPRFVDAKRMLAGHYMKAFKNMAGVCILKEPKNTESNYWLVTLIADTADAAWLNDTLTALHAAKLLCRPLWTPLHLLPMYKDAPRANLALTESLAQRIISLPSSAKLGF